MGVERQEAANAATAKQTEQQKKSLKQVGGDNLWVLKPWQVEIEPSFSYSPSSNDVVVVDGFSVFPVLVVGTVRSEEVRRDNYSAIISGRMGLPNGFQVDASIPYVTLHEERTRRDGTAEKSADEGVGDITLGLSKEILASSPENTGMVGRLQWKFANGDDVYDGKGLGIGSGFNALRGEVSAIQVVDPAVVYASLGYVWNFSTDKAGIGRINPGNGFDFNTGLSLALNRDLSLSFGYGNSFVLDSRLNGNKAVGSSLNQASLNMGIAYAITEKRALNISFSDGLTHDSPDYSFKISLPFSF